MSKALPMVAVLELSRTFSVPNGASPVDAIVTVRLPTFSVPNGASPVDAIVTVRLLKGEKIVCTCAWPDEMTPTEAQMLHVNQRAMAWLEEIGIALTATVARSIWDESLKTAAPEIAAFLKD